MLIKTSLAEGLVVSVEDAVRRLRIDADEDEADIEKMIRAATARVEQRTGRVLLPTEYEFRTDGWSSTYCLEIVPVRDIVEVVYLDSNNMEQPVSDNDWYWARHERGGCVTFVDGFSSPNLSSRDFPVRIRFIAGYDDPEASDAGDVPELAANPIDEQAVLMLVGHWYENREAVTVDAMSTVPNGFDDLVAERRIYW